VLRFRLMVKRGPWHGLKHQKEKRSMDHFAGLDVSVKETGVCIVDDTGRIVKEVKVASEPQSLLKVLGSPAYRFKRIGLEAGPLSQWLFSGLAEAGLPVVCVETRRIQKPSTTSLIHRYTPSYRSKTKCCVDRLRPPPERDTSGWNALPIVIIEVTLWMKHGSSGHEHD
jgi:hypothetical protein